MNAEQPAKSEPQERKRRSSSGDIARNDLTHAQLLEIAQLSQKLGGLASLKQAIDAYEKLADQMKHDVKGASSAGPK